MESREAKFITELLSALQQEMRGAVSSENSLYPDEYGGYERMDYHDGKVAGLEAMSELVENFLRSRIQIFAADQELMKNQYAMDLARILVMQITKYPSKIVDDMGYPEWLTILGEHGYYWNAAVKQWAQYPH